MIKAIVFDFDGVIGDTYELNFFVCQMIHEGLTKKEFEDHHNGNVYEQPVIKFDSENILVHTNKMQELFDAQHFFPIKDLIARLSQRYLLFINSSADDNSLKRYLDLGGMTAYFKGVMGGETHRLKIEKFKMLFEEYGFSNEECVFVTDTIGDIEEGKKVGVKTIAVTWGYHNRRILEGSSPTFIVDSILELEKVIEGLS